jgi:hypothetical protein
MNFATAVIQDCTESLSSIPDFQKESYVDDCFCKKNLNYVIRQINAEQTEAARDAVAKHWASIILYNNNEKAAGRQEGCPHNHVWCVERMKAVGEV